MAALLSGSKCSHIACMLRFFAVASLALNPFIFEIHSNQFYYEMLTQMARETMFAGYLHPDCIQTIVSISAGFLPCEKAGEFHNVHYQGPSASLPRSYP